MSPVRQGFPRQGKGGAEAQRRRRVKTLRFPLLLVCVLRCLPDGDGGEGGSEGEDPEEDGDHHAEELEVGVSLPDRCSWFFLWL